MAIDLKDFTNLKVGQKVRTTCCKTSTTAIVSRSRTEIRAYCFVCGAKPWMSMNASLSENLVTLHGYTASDISETPSTSEQSIITWPGVTTRALPMQARVWLASYSISPELSESLQFRWSIQLSRLILPCFDQEGRLVYWQGRALEAWRKPKYVNQASTQASSITFSSVRAGITPRNSQGPVILTEDIVSAVRVGHVYPAHALLGTVLTDGKIGAILASSPPAVLTWFDADGAGTKARKQARASLGLLGYGVRHIRTPHDPKKYSNREIEEIVNGNHEPPSEAIRKGLA